MWEQRRRGLTNLRETSSQLDDSNRLQSFTVEVSLFEYLQDQLTSVNNEQGTMKCE